ncbi:formin-like protein 18 [Phyllostomus discolor]|uniref:Formin-like protein 18 n=1 Tax=Phyllostomus discolor TaxID=89673 RepID=A0A7E6CLW4_9CHIR|nr:formin-like protein 18 [Phyllostomus discolor]
MCGSACLPGGGAGSPDLPLASPPPKVDQEPRPAPCEASGGHLAGGVRALSPVELPVVEAPPARVWRPGPPAPAGRGPPQTPTLLRRNTRRWPPESRPHSLETAPEASQPQGRVLPFFLEFMEMSVSDFLHKPQTSTSLSHTEE